jgi:hypothetical protein
MKDSVQTMSAQGGGDGPEAVTAALHEVNCLDYSPNSSRVCILIADAPPHGLGESGDGFPQGSPDGHDPIKIAKELATKGVVIYAVGVEPVLSTSYKYARDFMMTMASLTQGRFLPLGRADILSDVVVNTTIEALQINEFWAKFEAEALAEAASKGEKLNEAQLLERCEKQLHAKKAEVKMTNIEVAAPAYMAQYDDFNCQQFAQATSLSDAVQHLDAKRNARAAKESASYNWSAQSHVVMDAMPCSDQQAMRMVSHAKAKSSAK